MVGLGHIKGIATKEWGFMKKLPAADVLQFSSKDSTLSTLPEEIKDILAKTSSHRKMVGHLHDLIDMTDGKVTPYNNENVEDFFIRIGGYIMRTDELAESKAQLAKAA